jgi:short-subunit dehydrogenase
MNMLILGANSEIALACAHLFAQKEGANLYLASRNEAILEKKARDIELRHQVRATPLAFDALDYGSHEAFYKRLDPKPDVVLLAFGTLPDQKAAEHSFELAKLALDSNFTGAMSILEIVAADFEARGRGCIIGISSPAGLRGRKSNYFYGAAKAALLTYLSGLRHRLYPASVRVLTVFPGFTRTKMTEGMDLPAKLTADPAEVAADIYTAFRKGKDEVYSKWVWRWIMYIIRCVPNFLFKKTNL